MKSSMGWPIVVTTLNKITEMQFTIVAPIGTFANIKKSDWNPTCKTVFGSSVWKAI